MKCLIAAFLACAAFGAAAQLFVAGPPVVSHAMGYDVTKEDLGGWHIHCRNGSVDNLAESEEEAMAMTRRFLSYLPPSAYEAPPVVAAADPASAGAASARPAAYRFRQASASW